MAYTLKIILIEKIFFKLITINYTYEDSNNT